MRTIFGVGYNSLHKCDNCDRAITGDDLKGIDDIANRIDPGSTVPSGECPECGALCYPIVEPWNNNELQFARLLAEINATEAVSEDIFDGLCTSMDLTYNQLKSLFERAQTYWDTFKP